MANQVMVFKIPEEMNLELEKICKVEERSKAFLIRKSIQKLLEAKKTNGKTKRGAVNRTGF